MALHFSTRGMDVSTMRMGTISVLFMTYFLTQSIHSVNTFLKNIFHVATNVEGKQTIFLLLKLTEMTRKERNQKRKEDLRKFMSGVIYLKNTFFSTCLSKLQLLNVLKRHMLVTQLCLTLCNPMDYSLPGSTVHGNFQAKEKQTKE